MKSAKKKKENINTKGTKQCYGIKLHLKLMLKVCEVVLLRFDNPLSIEAFCLRKESKILISIPLFYSFQNPVFQ
jgi:hypothetical protein